MITLGNEIKEYHPGKAPIRLFVEGIVLVLLTIYSLLFLMTDYYFELPMRLHLIIVIYTAVNLFSMFRRTVIAVIFDCENGAIRITYYHYFFRKHTVVFTCSKAGFLAFNHATPLEPRKSCKELTELRFYDDRKYIARVVTSDKGWKSEQVVEMVDILEGFAHEFQVSPGLL